MSQVCGAGASAVPDGPPHIPNDQQQMRYDVLPGSNVEGTRRAVANGIATTSTMVNRLEMPPGQCEVVLEPGDDPAPRGPR